ncbi:hypothetical protein, partial [Citrobacter freundii]|uniref:hypothetical protein n=1 Tax=Citrobacter freundii TaxID=546 RepID=UPI003B43AFCF
MKKLICGWFQIKHLEPSYCLSTIRRDWQSFNTRTIERSPVGRNHALAYGVVAATIIFLYLSILLILLALAFSFFHRLQRLFLSLVPD